MIGTMTLHEILTLLLDLNAIGEAVDDQWVRPADPASEEMYPPRRPRHVPVADDLNSLVDIFNFDDGQYGTEDFSAKFSA